ncbi:MAG: M42 family peptidase, partial [Clostridia bacterium]|nr:M42 family peptidase [Clostridia bacterium]
RVRIGGSIIGVIGGKPIHLQKKEESLKLPKPDGLYIDIGLYDKNEVLKYVQPGDKAVILSDTTLSGDKILTKALDDRVGCAILISLLKEPSEYDFYATFTVQEELGLRGARTAAFSVNPDAAIALEGTTASDIAGVPDEKTVCTLGDGPVVSFMDRATVYDKEYYNAALNSGIKCQVKRAVTGGNNSGAIHLNREGVRTLAISVPCRYIHSAVSVADVRDADAALELARYMINGICGGKIK